MTLNDNNPIGVGTRFAAMLLDHVFMTFIAMGFFIPAIIADFSDAFSVVNITYAIGD